MNKELRYFKKYIKKYWLLMLVVVFLSIIIVLSMTAIPYLLGKGIDELSLFLISNESFNWTNFYIYIILTLIILSILVIFQYIFDILLGLFSEKVTMDLRNNVFENILNSNISFVDSNSHGDLISRVINDIDNINTGLTSVFKQFIQGLFQIVLTFIVMLYLNWILGLIVIVLTPFGFLLSYFVAKRSSKYSKKQAKIVGELSGTFLEYINNIETVISYNFGDDRYKKYAESNEKLNKIGVKFQFISSLTNPSSRLINNSTYALIGMIGVLIAAFAYKNGGVILGISATIGSVSTFLQYANQFAKPFNEISSCVSELQTAYTSLCRINKVLDEKPETNEGKEFINTDVEMFSFENVNFAYVGDKYVLKNINFKSLKGMKVAFVGPTGCGKTTIINLLLRFYDPQSGIIRINEINNKNVEKSNLRSVFGMVLQESWMFKGTIRENVSYSRPDATEEEIIEACKKANCLDFINRLPRGLDTKINNDSGLSAGQKQLISIARVILSNPEVVILDEATSNIDTRTELKIVKSLNELMKNKTSFIVAHRLSTIMNSDLIIVIKDGKIIESGSHSELLERKDFYYNLFNAQFNQ